MLSTFNLKLLFYVFLFLIFLIKTPPFYYIPGVNNTLFSSHSFAKIIIILIFVFLLFFFREKIKNVSKNKATNLLIFFLIFQSLSFISSKDDLLFWKSYHNIIVAIIIFITTLFFLRERQNKKVLNDFIIFTGFFLIVLELIFFLSPKKFIFYFQNIFQKEVFDAYLTNIYRGRRSLDLNLELFLPIFLVEIFTNKQNFLLIVFSIILIFLSFISNFRTRALMIFFGLLTFILIAKISKIKKIIFLIIFGMIVIFSLKISNLLYSFNIIDRFLELENVTIEPNSANFRINNIQKSIDFFLSSPLFGVGLGNYGLINENKEKYSFSILEKSIKNYYLDMRYSPHNILFHILSETGIFGLISFLAIIVNFFIEDYFYLKKRQINYCFGYILSYWSIFIFLLLNPSHTIFNIGWFWFIRGVIESLK